jgi:hypothetical protein
LSGLELRRLDDESGRRNRFLSARDEAERDARALRRVFDTVEVDSTFYAIPASGTIENWYRKTPDDFIFSLRCPRKSRTSIFCAILLFRLLPNFASAFGCSKKNSALRSSNAAAF